MGYKDPEKQRAYQRAWVKQRRAAFLADRACVKCGSRENLELHHRDPSLKVDHKIWSWTEERRALEIAKCEVLCGWCHYLKTALARVPAHGKLWRYDGYGCRCDACKEAKKQRNARDRHKWR